MMPTLDYTALGVGQVWLTADLHFGHDKVRKHRPWANTSRMDNALISNLNKQVGSDDLLIIVGDLTLFGGDRSNYVERIIHRMPGQKILVYGNHDRFKPKWYLNRGFILAATSLVLPGGVLVTHDPADATVWPPDKPVLCGHVHKLFKSINNVVNVGVDVWDYQPVKLEDAVALHSPSTASVDWVSLSENRHK